jgi:hypothetical protein
LTLVLPPPIDKQESGKAQFFGEIIVVVFYFTSSEIAGKNDTLKVSSYKYRCPKTPWGLVYF